MGSGGESCPIRFVNDFRNTGRTANVHFKMRVDSKGDTRQGVYVLAKEGVQAGEELLISYGKSFWRSRIPNRDLDAFVRQTPGQSTEHGNSSRGPQQRLGPTGGIMN